MRILVTGGEGFIGRNIIALAKEKGWETISVDIAEKTGDADDFRRISILDKEGIRNALKDVDYVFHEAAMTSPPEFETEPDLGYLTNVYGTFNVLNSSLENGVRKVVLASSSATYGNSSKMTLEEDVDHDFMNIYPMSKHINEITASFYARTSDMETVCLRYFNTYGTGENSKGFYSSVIHKFIDDLSSKRTPVIFGDGNQSRDFVYVKDVATANFLAAEKGKNGEAYNIGSGVTTPFNDIYEIIREEMKSSVEAQYSPIPFKSYQMFTQADISKAQKGLGYKPQYDLRAGIREILGHR